MASTWVHLKGTEPSRPVSFRVLVQMVRADALAAEDLVRAEWEEVWRPAASVVGLFKMAGRADVLAKWEEERLAAERAARREDATDEGAVGQIALRAEQGFPLATSGDADAFLGFGLGGAQAALHTGLQPSRRDEGPCSVGFNLDESVTCFEAESGVSRKIESAIDAAMTEEYSKAIRRAEARRPSAWSRLQSAGVELGVGALRWGGALLFANLTAIGILSWSELQRQRFPERSVQAAHVEIFPLWGRCSPREYTFLLTDAILLAGLFGYLAARYIDGGAEDAPQA